MKKSFIVEDVTANLNKITCLTDEIKEGIEFRCLNAIGVWHVEGKNNDAMEDYMQYDDEKLNTESLFGGLSVADRVNSINNKIDEAFKNQRIGYPNSRAQ